MTRLLFALWLLVGTAQAQFFDSGWDWEAYQWQTNCAISGGSLGATSYNNGTIFMNQSKRWGIRPLLGRVNLCLGPNTNAMLCSIIRDFFAASKGNDRTVGFTAANYSEATGLGGGGSGKALYFNGTVSDMSLSAAAHTNIHLAMYSRVSNNNNEYDMGAIFSGHEYSVIFSYGGTCYLRLGDDTSTSAALSAPLGLLLATRTATNFAACYHNTTQVVSRAVNTPGTTSGSSISPAHCVYSGGETAFSTKTYSYYAVGYGVQASLVPAYQILVNGVQKRAGRAVVP
jgi:hypothetical protein